MVVWESSGKVALERSFRLHQKPIVGVAARLFRRIMPLFSCLSCVNPAPLTLRGYDTAGKLQPSCVATGWLRKPKPRFGFQFVLLVLGVKRAFVNKARFTLVD